MTSDATERVHYESDPRFLSRAMKSIRRAFLGNQEYHHNLLGEEFDTLVEEATEKTLTRPNDEANKTVRHYIPPSPSHPSLQVIQAISDPNTGMELTPGVKSITLISVRINEASLTVDHFTRTEKAIALRRPPEAMARNDSNSGRPEGLPLAASASPGRNSGSTKYCGNHQYSIRLHCHQKCKKSTP